MPLASRRFFSKAYPSVFGRPRTRTWQSAKGRTEFSLHVHCTKHMTVFVFFDVVCRLPLTIRLRGVGQTGLPVRHRGNNQRVRLRWRARGRGRPGGLGLCSQDDRITRAALSSYRAWGLRTPTNVGKQAFRWAPGSFPCFVEPRGRRGFCFQELQQYSAALRSDSAAARGRALQDGSPACSASSVGPALWLQALMSVEAEELRRQVERHVKERGTLEAELARQILCRCACGQPVTFDRLVAGSVPKSVPWLPRCRICGQRLAGLH